MAKVILALEGKILRELKLTKDRITIGRRPHNDLPIYNPAVSGMHAAIVKVRHDAYVEDLNSTNGTKVNGQPVKKHFLQNGDVIELLKYRLTYVADEQVTGRFDTPTRAPAALHEDENADLEETLDALVAPTRFDQAVAIKVLNGASAGQEFAITKTVSTIGCPGVQVAAIVQRPQGYCIAHIEGSAYPLLNGTSIGAEERPMTHGDVIDLSGTKMTFSLY